MFHATDVSTCKIDYDWVVRCRLAGSMSTGRFDVGWQTGSMQTGRQVQCRLAGGFNADRQAGSMQTGRQGQCRPAGRFNAGWQVGSMQTGRQFNADWQAGSIQTGCLDSVQAGWFAVDWPAGRFRLAVRQVRYLLESLGLPLSRRCFAPFK